jgi:hypothetical protein
MNIRPKHDSRALVFQHQYGYTTKFPDEYNADNKAKNEIQPFGDVKCVLYTIRDILRDKDGLEIDMVDLESRISMAKDGTDPVRAVKEVVKNGVLPIGGTERVFPVSSYFQAHTGLFDAFDNVRSCIMLAEYPVMAYGQWFYNWGRGGVVSKGQSFSGYHCADNDGWKLKIATLSTGEPAISCEAWTGDKYYMTREVFNDWASRYGFGTLVLSTKKIDAIREKTMLETIRDAYLNVVILLLQMKVQVLEGLLSNKKKA